MVLTLTVFYEIPQLNIGSVFLLKSDEYLTNASGYDSEKARIQGATIGGVSNVLQEGNFYVNTIP